jgi:chromosome segregation protein
MKLKRVRIFGFKTFADRTEFSLEGGVVAVLGPNGCGKSNLVDAILWGLGESNARHLRAQTNQDVIFSGSGRRKAVGFAEVSLLFDNEDGTLPIDAPEVSITRRLNRAGESEYQINRQTCRQRDVYDLLADSGLGRSGYAIVGQKEIDQALAASAEDRRAWVDEAAGVQRYRARKVESLRRLASARDHLTRVEDLLRELNSQREPLREEAEVAARYKQALGSLREVELGLLIDEIVRALRDVEALSERIEASGRLARAEIERAEALDDEVSKAGRRISEIEGKLELLRNRLHAGLTAAERAEASVRLAEGRLASLDELEGSFGEDAAEAEARLAEIRGEIEALEKEATEEREALEAVEAEFAQGDAEAKALAKELQEIDRAVQAAREAQSRRLKREAEERHRRERLAESRRELDGIAKTLPDLEGAVAEAEAASEEAEGEVGAVQSELEAVEARLQEMAREEERQAQEVRKALAERASLEGRRRGIEATIEAHEGLNQGARAVLQAVERGELSGEYLPVAEALGADREHALAVETALGGSANDLIVEHESDAKRAIAWLKERRAGRATFQPIPLMRPHREPPELRRVLEEPGVLGTASDLVRFEERHRPVVESLLGRIVVVEHLEVALRLARTSGWSRLVTLEGELVHSSGAVTGGAQAKQGYGLVQRRADLAEIEASLAELERVVGRHERDAGKRVAGRAEADARLRELRQTLAERRKAAREAGEFHHTIRDEMKATLRARDRLEAELERLSLPIADEPESQRLEEVEAARDDVLRRLAAKSANAEGAEARLREAEARVEQATARLESARRRLRAAEESEEARARRLANIGPERERLAAEIEAHREARDRASAQRQEAEGEIARLQADRKEILERSLDRSEEAKAARANAASIGDTVHQAELNRARLEAKRANAQARLLEEYGLSEEEARAQEGRHEVPPDAPALVSRLRRELKAMGDVNLGAIDAFARLSERLEELQAQYDDIVGGMEQVQASIAELDKLTRDRFLTTFQALEVAYGETFQKLFEGGEGKISLSEPENLLESGIDIDVTLPGKRRQRLDLLSGGERALCATAFLFALLKVKAPPLAVLDEVDAPLDGRNVERFVALLRSFTDRTQFILVTHNPTTIFAADVWLGVTMQEPGVSMLAPVHLPVQPEALAEHAVVPDSGHDVDLQPVLQE